MPGTRSPYLGGSLSTSKRCYFDAMTYIIHGARGSGSSIIEAACVELGVDYDVHDLDGKNDEHRGDDYAALNPQRKVPTLEVEGGELIPESVAILLTLDERHRAGELMPPPGSRDRGQALRWMIFLAAEMYPIVEIMDFPERFVASAECTESVLGRAKEIWRERWLIVENHIAGSPYCVPGGFSATDLYITVLSRWEEMAEWRRENLPRVEALANEVLARPALAHVWARHFPKDRPQE